MADDKKTLIWDLPLRFFHWALVTLVVTAWVSVEIMDDLDLHFLTGYGILALMLFRITWGIWGTYHARFKHFVCSPKKVKAYLKGDTSFYRGGHNPLGALSVILLLSVVTAQAISGLFSDDEYYYFGPFNSYVSSSVASLMSEFHHLNFDIILVAVALHLFAIAFYEVVKKERLIKPMFIGYKRDFNDTYTSITSNQLGRAILVMGLAITAVFFIANLAESA